MGTCVDCICYAPKREWCFLFPVKIHRCASPVNMIEEFDHVTGTAKLAHCYEYNSKGECNQFIKRSGE